MPLAQSALPKLHWDAESIKALRRFLRQSQSAFARTLGVRQQTVSEWETGVYRPRGASTTVLSIIARDSGFGSLDHPPPEPGPAPTQAGAFASPQEYALPRATFPPPAPATESASRRLPSENEDRGRSTPHQTRGGYRGDASASGGFHRPSATTEVPM